MKIVTLWQLRDVFFSGAFVEAKRLQLLKDGTYVPKDDCDVIGMYCMGDEL